MDRRDFTLCAFGALALPRIALGQAARKVWRVGYLSMSTPDGDGAWVAAKKGFEGQNLILELRYAANQLLLETAAIVLLAALAAYAAST